MGLSHYCTYHTWQEPSRQSTPFKSLDPNTSAICQVRGQSDASQSGQGSTCKSPPSLEHHPPSLSPGKPRTSALLQGACSRCHDTNTPHPRATSLSSHPLLGTALHCLEFPSTQLNPGLHSAMTPPPTRPCRLLQLRIPSLPLPSRENSATATTPPPPNGLNKVARMHRSAW